MLKKSEIVLISVFLLLLLSVGYYVFFFQPASDRMAELDAAISRIQGDLDTALIQTVQYSALVRERDQNSLTHTELLQEWEALRGEYNDAFSDTLVLNQVRRLVYPHTEQVNVNFQGVIAAGDATTVHSVLITFSTGYDALTTILTGFKEDTALRSRIISYEISRVIPTDTGRPPVFDDWGEPVREPERETQYNTVLRLEYLVPNQD